MLEYNQNAVDGTIDALTTSINMIESAKSGISGIKVPKGLNCAGSIASAISKLQSAVSSINNAKKSINSFKDMYVDTENKNKLIIESINNFKDMYLNTKNKNKSIAGNIMALGELIAESTSGRVKRLQEFSS